MLLFLRDLWLCFVDQFPDMTFCIQGSIWKKENPNLQSSSVGGLRTSLHKGSQRASKRRPSSLTMPEGGKDFTELNNAFDAFCEHIDKSLQQSVHLTGMLCLLHTESLEHVWMQFLNGVMSERAKV